MADAPASLRVIKRYAGGRLYDAAALAYVTADDVRALIAGGVALAVLDAASGSDVTKAVLEWPDGLTKTAS